MELENKANSSQAKDFIPDEAFLDNLEIIINYDVLVEEDNWEIIEKGPQEESKGSQNENQ